MKGDFSRNTFKKEKHYSGVRMQQGRVLLDADWNEYVDIQAHLKRTGISAVIGDCGAPLKGNGFEIEPTADGKDLTISPGCIYVDGILCGDKTKPDETKPVITYKTQEDYPDAKNPDSDGTYLAYLDVWEQHISALEDDGIREKALGGPDTATRTRTIWQLKLLPLETTPANCFSVTELDAWKYLMKESGKLAALARKEEQDTHPCIVPGAGYRGLKNQLYRVEIHRSGEQEGGPTFKWAKNNGSIAVRWLEITDNKLTVSSTGRDRETGFASGQWVELTDDKHELMGEPGILVMLEKVEGQILTIDPSTATGTVDLGNFPRNPKVRRWDSEGELLVEIPTDNNDWIPLEEGLEVKFEEGSFRTGDYWLIPARTGAGEGEVEWPKEASDPSQPLPQHPHGIRHHYCPLALLTYSNNGNEKFTRVADCRKLFAPLTEMVTISHVCGDGQEAMPGEELASPLGVKVSLGNHPVKGAKVQFEVLKGGGSLSPIPGTQSILPLLISTDNTGTAACSWKLGKTSAQRVKASLLDTVLLDEEGKNLEINGKPAHPSVCFNADLSLASNVYYDSSTCPILAGKTVKDALDTLCTKEYCCKVSVGDNGQFGSLQEAITSLMEEGKTNIRICLLQGDHVLTEELEVSGGHEVHLRIEGCGSGTRIVTQKLLRFKELVSFTFKDVELDCRGIENPLTFERCEEVTVENCHLIGMSSSGLLMDINGFSRLFLEKNIIETYQSARLELHKNIFTYEGEGPDLSTLFQGFDRKSFESKALIVSKELAEIGEEMRKERREKIKEGIETRELSTDEKESYGIFLKLLTSDSVNSELLAAALKNILDAATRASPGTAIIIEDISGDTVLEDNKIVGNVSLYGGNKKENLDDNNLKFILEYLSDDNDLFTFPGTGKKSLHMRGNSLNCLTIGNNILEILKTGSNLEFEENKKVLNAAYNRIYLSENLFETEDNQFLAENLFLSSNRFEIRRFENQVPRAGWGIAYSAVYIGNSAPPAGGGTIIKLHSASRSCEKAANLNIGITYCPI